MRSTLIVRRLMQKFGKNSVYTNLYPKCHTVKCYSNGGNDGLIAELQKTLTAANIPFSIKTKEYDNGRCWGPHDSLIVRLPR